VLGLPVPAPGESPYGFTPAEVRMVGRLAASLGNGCRLSLAAPGTERIAAIAPGVVVLHPDHTLAAITGEAERLLADVADYSSRAARLPAAVYAAAACLQSIDRGTALSDASPTVRVRTRLSPVAWWAFEGSSMPSRRPRLRRLSHYCWSV
jgi:hypothetical protein